MWKEYSKNVVYKSPFTNTNLKSNLLKTTESIDLIPSQLHSKLTTKIKQQRPFRFNVTKRRRFLRNINFYKLHSSVSGNYLRKIPVSKRLVFRTPLANRHSFYSLYKFNKTNDNLNLFRSSTRLTFKLKRNKNSFKSSVKRRRSNRKKITPFSTKNLCRYLTIKILKLHTKFRSIRKPYRVKSTSKSTINSKRIEITRSSLKLSSLYTLNSSSITHSVINNINFNIQPLAFSKKENNRSYLSTTQLRINNLINSYLINYTSLFLNFRVFMLNNSFKSEKYLMKKMIFSFLKPNEAKKLIMLRRKKIYTSRFYKKLYRSSLASNAINKNRSLNNKLMSKSSSYSMYFNKYNKKLSFGSKDSFELYLPRVKFKPGYQRIWRQSRKAIAESIGLKYIYQKQMTKYMNRLSRKVNNYTFSLSENSLDKAILYSRLLPDMKTTKEFLELGLIHLNGWKIKSLSNFVLPGDFIQLTISRWLSVYFRWLVIWSKNNKGKFKKLVFRKNLAASYKLMKQRKQRSKHVPLWIYNSRFDISDIKSNIPLFLKKFQYKSLVPSSHSRSTSIPQSILQHDNTYLNGSASVGGSDKGAWTKRFIK